MSTLLLLRHGQASFGADRYDALSDRGREQAEHVGQYFAARAQRIDRIWIGPRDRHRLTARYALEPLKLDWKGPAEIALDEFAEGQQILGAAQIRQGVKLRGEGAVTGKDAARHYVTEIDAWAESRSVIDGVPNVAEFRATAAAWLARATQDPAPGQIVLAVTSGGVIASIVANLLELADIHVARFMNVIYNGSLTELAFSAGRAPSLVNFNVASYLPEQLLTRI